MTRKTLGSSLVALSLVALTCLASDPKSAADQYPVRHDQSQPLLSIDEALKILKSRHRFDLQPEKPSSKDEYTIDNDIVPDLQVGCGDGLLVESTTTPRPKIPEHKKVFARKERRKRQTGERKSRDYFSYSVYTPSSFSYSLWKPEPYRIQRPYFIPIWGSQGRLPIYLPPQPVFLNPGFPLDNPPNRQYPLPIRTTTEKLPTTTSTEEPMLGNRFGGDEPVWDSRPANPTTTTTSTFPPLIHNINPPSATTVRPVAAPTTGAVLLSAPALSIGKDLILESPPAPQPSRPPAAPQPSPPPAAFQPSRPPAPTSPCGWAIINCCSAGSRDVSSSCFERLGCPGPFWDRTPCESDFTREAILMAMNYYEAK